MATLGEDPTAIEALLRFTSPFDVTGSPTITLPCGFTEAGTPVAFQFVSRHLEEDLLVRAGHLATEANQACAKTEGRSACRDRVVAEVFFLPVAIPLILIEPDPSRLEVVAVDDQIDVLQVLATEARDLHSHVLSRDPPLHRGR